MIFKEHFYESKQRKLKDLKKEGKKKTFAGVFYVICILSDRTDVFVVVRECFLLCLITSKVWLRSRF